MPFLGSTFIFHLASRGIKLIKNNKAEKGYKIARRIDRSPFNVMCLNTGI